MSTRFQEIPIDQLAIHPKNVRKDVGIVTDLANSISAQGIMQPLVVAPDYSKDAYGYVIIAGHRRHAAAKLANLDVIPCVIREDLNTAPKQLEAMLVENTQRTDLTINEEASAYQTLAEFDGYTIKSIAKATGRSQSLVRSRIALAKLSEDAKGKIEDRTLNIDQALALVEFTDDEAATKRLLQVADKPNDWAFRLAQESKSKVWIENLPRLTAELQGAGVEIVDRPSGPRWGWMEWQPSYKTDMTVAEAVAEGWSAICDDSEPEITWVKRRSKPVPYVPERTREQIAAEKKERELRAGLEIAAEVRTTFIKNAIQNPAADKTKTLLLDYITERCGLGDIAPWLDIDHEDIDEQEVIDAIAKLSIPQLVALMHVDSFERETHMSDLAAWSDSANRWASTDSWRERLQNVYGYHWTEAEQAVIDYHQAEAVGADDE